MVSKFSFSRYQSIAAISMVSFWSLIVGSSGWRAEAIECGSRRHALTQQAAAAITLAFGVPPMLLGLPGDNTYSNYAEANRSFWRQTARRACPARRAQDS